MVGVENTNSDKIMSLVWFLVEGGQTLRLRPDLSLGTWRRSGSAERLCHS